MKLKPKPKPKSDPKPKPKPMGDGDGDRDGRPQRAVRESHGGNCDSFPLESGIALVRTHKELPRANLTGPTGISMGKKSALGHEVTVETVIPVFLVLE